MQGILAPFPFYAIEEDYGISLKGMERNFKGTENSVSWIMCSSNVEIGTKDFGNNQITFASKTRS